MIGLSMCSIAWRQDDVSVAIRDVGDAGYDGIELWGPHIERYLDAGQDMDALRALLGETSLTVPMVSPYFDFADRYDDSIVTARRFVQYAVDLRAPLVRLFTGGGPSDQGVDNTEGQGAPWRTLA